MRNITFRGYNRVKFPSLKLGKMIFCKSLLVRDYLIHLEWDDTVTSYELKPFKIAYKADGKRRFFTPHLLVNAQANQTKIVWLISSTDLEKGQEKFIKLVSNACSGQGYSFEIKRAYEIRNDPFFSNLKILQRYARFEITIKQIFLCNDFFAQTSAPCLGDLMKFFSCRNEPMQAVFALLAQKIVSADLNSELIDDELSLRLVNSLPAFINGRLIK